MKAIIKYLLVITIVILYSNPNHLFSQSNFWNPTNGPFGGTGREIYTASNGDIFAGSFNGGMFRSTNGGNNWDEYGLGGTSPYAITVNQSGDIFTGTSHGTFRSTDNGQTWVLVYFSTINSLQISTSQYIIGGSQGGSPTSGSIFRSEDNGNSWQTVGPNNNAIFCLTIDLSGTLYAGSTFGVYRSTDEGLNWNNIGLPGQTIFSIAVDSLNNLFAGASNGIHRSTDNGTTWNFTSLGYHVNDIKIAGSQRMYAGTFSGGVFFSSNGFDWSPLNTGLTNPNVWSLGINLSGDVIAGTEGGGLFKFPFNGNSWVQSDNGFSNTFVNALARSPNGNIFAGTGELFGAIYISSNNGTDWIKLNTGNTTSVSSIGINTFGHIFAGTYGGGILRSLNNGANWSLVNSGLTNLNINAIVFTFSQNVFAATEGGGVFRSTNNGSNWSAVNIGIINFTITSLAVNSNNVLYAGSYGNGVYSSTNEGEIWISVNSDLTDLLIISLAVNSSGHIFAGTEVGGVFRSTNSGGSWQSLGLASARVIELTTAAFNNDIFAGSNYEGAFQSTDNGNSWNEINGGLDNTTVPSILIHSTGFAFAGTYGNGVFKSINPLTNISNTSTNIITEFKLFDNYPNPFNPVTAIKFNLPVESNVKLNIYDMTGREVAVLANERLETGAHEYKWNASEFSSGTYFCRIETEGFTEVKKMTLIK